MDPETAMKLIVLKSMVVDSGILKLNKPWPERVKAISF